MEGRAEDRKGRGRVIRVSREDGVRGRWTEEKWAERVGEKVGREGGGIMHVYFAWFF